MKDEVAEAARREPVGVGFGQAMPGRDLRPDGPGRAGPLAPAIRTW
ncbi:hypothetical protein HLH33_14105 [Gluconacetobacter diazotrophicus]|uniref:Uncharacterized protein n=1 Tax=Gluconacetobacter diazotrophicus TaxID=33996 RepID=A0A7W4I700_GLUDI|nr:hypothetical protein [Gluconacetobacter diazotrophicus]MBB2157434.1 hypothetical protein [Gluconacetobacter diazotrophicus]